MSHIYGWLRVGWKETIFPSLPRLSQTFHTSHFADLYPRLPTLSRTFRTFQPFHYTFWCFRRHSMLYSTRRKNPGNPVSLLGRGVLGCGPSLLPRKTSPHIRHIMRSPMTRQDASWPYEKHQKTLPKTQFSSLLVKLLRGVKSEISKTGPQSQ